MTFQWHWIAYALALIAPFLMQVIRCMLYASKHGQDPVAVWNFIHGNVLLRVVPSLPARIFNSLLGQVNPFSRSISMRITSISRQESNAVGRQGVCRATMWDRPSSRNPFRSIHAAALILFGETVCGVAVLSSLKRGERAIVKRLSGQYHKKSRGTLTAECTFTRPTTSGEIESIAILRDSSMDVVAEVTAVWAIDVEKE